VFRRVCIPPFLTLYKLEKVNIFCIICERSFLGLAKGYNTKDPLNSAFLAECPQAFARLDLAVSAQTGVLYLWDVSCSSPNPTTHACKGGDEREDGSAKSVACPFLAAPSKMRLVEALSHCARYCSVQYVRRHRHPSRRTAISRSE
jgi:hypothetical protein